MKREILDHLPPDADEIDGEEEDKEMSESCENNQPAEDPKENGHHPEANGRLKGAAVRVVNDTTTTEGKPNESNSVQTTKAHWTLATNKKWKSIYIIKQTS